MLHEKFQEILARVKPDSKRALLSHLPSLIRFDEDKGLVVLKVKAVSLKLLVSAMPHLREALQNFYGKKFLVFVFAVREESRAAK